MAQIDETIGKRLSKYRKIEGWSAQKLADESGLTRSVITNIENGRRDDLTVSELLALCAALRVPPAALLFPVDRPLGPGQVGGDDLMMQPRTVELVDWLNGADADFGDDEELAEFSSSLEELDAVVLYPIGVTVWSTYGAAGRQARTLIRSGRQLARAQDRVDRLRREVLIFSRLALSERSEEFYELLNGGALSGSRIADEFVAELDPADQPVAQRLVRASDAAVNNLRDAQAQFRLLGGDPMGAGALGGIASPRAAMDLVTMAPHEPRSETVARGELSEGVVSSPLRLYRDDQLDRIRARWGTDRSSSGEYQTEV